MNEQQFEDELMDFFGLIDTFSENEEQTIYIKKSINL